MAKSVLSSDSLPKAGRVNEVCREWLVHEDGALAYRLQDEEIKEHYTGNKVRNAQVREDLPKAKVEQELEAMKYQNHVHEQEERDALVARQIALTLEKEERLKERELRDWMRLQLRLDDEAAQIEAQNEIQRRMQEEKDQELARKLQEEEKLQPVEDRVDGLSVNNQFLLDQKIAMEAQDAELAKMLQEKERIKAKRARERARQKKLERQQLQRQSEEHNEEEQERAIRPDKLDLKASHDKSNSRSRQVISEQQYPDPDEIYVLEDSVDADVHEVTNVAAIIDPTYNVQAGSSSSSSSNTVSPAYLLPSPPQELMGDEMSVCSGNSNYMPVQGQRRSHNQFSTAQMNEEKHKRRLVKDSCKQQ